MKRGDPNEFYPFTRLEFYTCVITASLLSAMLGGTLGWGLIRALGIAVPLFFTVYLMKKNGGGGHAA